MTGVTVDREDWHWDQVPDHLKITFRVVDDKNKKLKEGRSLQDLKDALKGKVQETLSAVADDGIEQSGFTYLEFWSTAGKLRAEARQLQSEGLAGAGG